MKRLALACLLAMPGLATAFEVTVGRDPVIVNPPPDFGTLPPFTGVSATFLITPLNFDSVYRAQDAVPGIPVAPNPGSMLLGEPVILTIEEQGVRMPDEQFSLP